jgi:hypothetical protein
MQQTRPGGAPGSYVGVQSAPLPQDRAVPPPEEPELLEPPALLATPELPDEPELDITPDAETPEPPDVLPLVDWPLLPLASVGNVAPPSAWVPALTARPPHAKAASRSAIDAPRWEHRGAARPIAVSVCHSWAGGSRGGDSSRCSIPRPFGVRPPSFVGERYAALADAEGQRIGQPGDRLRR